MAAPPDAVVGIATCTTFLGEDDDAPALADALSRAGLASREAAWDDPTVDWSAFTIVVLRSTWDSVGRPAAYVAWIERVASCTTLVNAPEVVTWCFDKRHLAGLAAEGAPVVPTVWIEPGDEAWELLPSELVIKPAISGGGIDSARYRVAQADDARAHIRRLQTEGRTVMMQEYLSSVDEQGETGCIFFAGAYSHAITKGPLLRRDVGIVERLWEHEVIAAVDPRPAHLEVAEQMMATITARFGAPPTYARIDVVEGNDEEPLVLELELVDPSLFLGTSEGAADRFAAALEAQIETVTG
jgi:glutathione synthase/RimK-type ligase-like ATP-grasp enzyme